MTVSRNDFARGHCVSHKLPNIIAGPAISVLFLETKKISEALLVSQAVERSSKTIHSSGEGKIGV